MASTPPISAIRRDHVCFEIVGSSTNAPSIMAQADRKGTKSVAVFVVVVT
jgi:hypothetical protein